MKKVILYVVLIGFTLHSCTKYNYRQKDMGVYEITETRHSSYIWNYDTLGPYYTISDTTISTFTINIDLNEKNKDQIFLIFPNKNITDYSSCNETFYCPVLLQDGTLEVPYKNGLGQSSFEGTLKDGEIDWDFVYSTKTSGDRTHIKGSRKNKF